MQCQETYNFYSIFFFKSFSTHYSILYKHPQHIYIFIFQLLEYPCNITNDIYIVFLYTTDIPRTKTDIPQIFLERECIFLRVNVTFYDTVNIIHDVITTVNPFPYTAKFLFVGVKNNKTQQVKC